MYVGSFLLEDEDTFPFKYALCVVTFFQKYWMENEGKASFHSRKTGSLPRLGEEDQHPRYQKALRKFPGE